MKKNYLFKTLSTLFLSLFISLQSFAQLGTDVYTLGLDNSNNYGGSWVATSAGTGLVTGILLTIIMALVFLLVDL